ncbi:MAG: hypothetical protein K8R21_02585, partial [Leptospira sp.]|nr:hypothetical protein [Leptospira sp.]
MITYEYEPYKPDDDNQFTPERLMSMLSDMIMKYNISLDEALKLLIEKGVPVNIFLKEGGMSDLVSQFLEQINESIREILEKYEIQTARDTLKKGNSDSSGKIEKSLKKFPELSLEIEKAMKEENQDLIRRLLWSLQT